MPMSYVTASLLLLFNIYAGIATLEQYSCSIATYRRIKCKVILIIMFKVLSLHELLEYKYGLVHKITQSCIILVFKTKILNLKKE